MPSSVQPNVDTTNQYKGDFDEEKSPVDSLLARIQQ